MCRRRSTRLVAVVGGLVTALATLFSSFSTQFPQLFLSQVSRVTVCYCPLLLTQGLLLGAGVACTHNSFLLILGQYFKRRREVVELVVVGGAGAGLAAMSSLLRAAVTRFGWRLGLQAVTVALTSTFFIGQTSEGLCCCLLITRDVLPVRLALPSTAPRHSPPQEPDKENKGLESSGPLHHRVSVQVKAGAGVERAPLLDLSCLRSRTVRVSCLAASLAGPALLTPLLLLPAPPQLAGLGTAWLVGVLLAGVVNLTRLPRQQLCQV